MLKAKDKEARRGNLITFAIVLVLTLVTMVLENVMSPGSLLFTVIKKGAVYSLVAVSMNLLNGFTGLFSLGQAGFMLLGVMACITSSRVRASTSPSRRCSSICSAPPASAAA